MFINLPVVKTGWTSGNTVDSVVSLVMVVGDETTVTGKQRRWRFDDGDGARDSNGLFGEESRSCSNERFNAIQEAIDKEIIRKK